MPNFPTSLDTLTNPTATDYLNSPSHAGQHATANDILEALEAKVGITSSAVTSSHDYKLALVTGTAKALPDSYLDTDGTLAGNSDVRIATQKATKTYVDAITRYSNLSLSTGQVINGKIVVTVTSNNITLALKGADGNDPSASNPVYCKIGGVIRSVTAALPVTKNAGTNWMNAGSAELATKEIDYFVYLGYNATDGVVIGFSRIPFAAQYSDFSVTTTNEKYAAISTISNAASTDYYEVIGRFAATLSAGAGYTWSVPTYTAINLIQRPIYETRWLDAVASATGFSSKSSDIFKYKIIGINMFFSVVINGISNSTTITYKSAMAPVDIQYTIISVSDAGTIQAGLYEQLVSGTHNVFKTAGGGAFTASGGKQVNSFHGFFRIA